MPEFAREYFQEYPSLLAELQSLERRRNIRVFKKLIGEKSEINFYSWLSEMRIGLYLDGIVSQLFYEKNICNKTPDWVGTMNGQEIIFEVLRLNTNESELLQRIDEERKLRNFRKENPGVPVITYSGAKVLSSEYCYGAQSKLQAKEFAYRQVVFESRMPFIICATPTLDTFIGDLDFFDFLIGHNKGGFFYTDENFGKTVTGILLKTFWGGYVYFHNELARNQLNSESDAFFKSLRYSE